MFFYLYTFKRRKKGRKLFSHGISVLFGRGFTRDPKKQSRVLVMKVYNELIEIHKLMGLYSF